MKTRSGLAALVAAASAVCASGQLLAQELDAQTRARLLHVGGSAYMSTGNYKSALESFNEAIRLDPAYAHAYDSRGHVRYTLGDDPAALADFNKAIELDPKLPGPYFGRGVIQMDLQVLDAALADLNKALDIQPYPVDVWVARGNLGYQKGDAEGALADLRRAERLNREREETLKKYPEGVIISPHPKDDGSYLRFLLRLVQTPEAQSAVSGRSLAASLHHRWRGGPGPFTRVASKLLNGTMSEADFTSAMSSENPEEDRVIKCAAHYYLGIKKRMDGDKRGATDHFRDSIATGKKDMIEYKNAQVEMRRLSPF